MRTKGGRLFALAAVACVTMMLIGPYGSIGQTISGVVEREAVKGKTNTIGEANVELYNYLGIDSSTYGKVLQSGSLQDTERGPDKLGKTTDTPFNATGPDFRYNTADSVAGPRPNNTKTITVSQVKNGNMMFDQTWLGGVSPTGQSIDSIAQALQSSMDILVSGNINDSQILGTAPTGTPAIDTRGNDSRPSLEELTGTAQIAPVTDDASFSLVQPSGAPTIDTFRGNASGVMFQPEGVQDNLVRDLAGIKVNIAPSGAHAIEPLTLNMTNVSVQPSGVPASISGEYYIGNFSVDGNESGVADSVVEVVLIDTTVSGVYDRMALSINDVVFDEGDLGDTTVDWGAGGNTNDELISATTDVTLGNAPLFTLSFASDPNATAFDANITSKEWYTGSFLIDADEDGAADDTVFFSIYDMDSDGVFDSVDLSLGDGTFGEGAVGNEQVLAGDDETLNRTLSSGGDHGPDDFGYTWTYSSPYSWIEINESGTDLNLRDDDYATTIDLGFDFVYYDKTFNNTSICSNGWITFNESDDWDLTWYPWEHPSDDDYEGGLCIMCEDLDPSNGGDIYYETNGTAPYRYFVVEYEDIQDFGGGYAKTAQIILYETTNIIKFQWMELGDKDFAVGIEHNDESTGIGTDGNETADCWIDVDNNITNGTAITFFPPGSGRSLTNIGEYLYRFQVDPTPSASAFDLNLTSNEWFTEIIPFDTNAVGTLNGKLFYMIGDTDSNGIFDTLDLSLNGTFGVGNLGDDIVNETNGERYVFGTTPATITIGPSLPFSIDFDRYPEADDDDLRLTALRWYQGTFTVDADDDGVVDDVFYYVLTDTDSNGAYETIDISFADQTFGEGGLTDGNVTSAGDDERYVGVTSVLLGQTIHWTIMTGGNPSSSKEDILVYNKWTYKGNITFDSDNDGEADDDLLFVISDSNSDGIYDVVDLSFDQIFGEGDQGDSLVTAKPFNDERLTAEGDVELGVNVSFTVGFDPDPQSDNEDFRLTVHVWFGGTFLLDADDDGDPVEEVFYALTDTDSDGFFDTMDLSLGDQTFGQGDLNDGTLASGNDERITESTVLSIGPSLRFNATFSGSPGGTMKDATLVNNDLYTGSFQVDIGLGVVLDDIYYAISDSDSDGNYDTLDLSLGDEIYREDLDWDGYVDINGNDERMTEDGKVRIGAFVYDLTYVPNPHVATTDVVVTSAQWYLGNFSLDADSDGQVDELIEFLISDLDSNGLYDRMDLSLGDGHFGEGNVGDLSLGAGEDEVLADLSEVSIGDLLLEFRFTSSPNQNIEDAWMRNLRWFTGAIDSLENNWTVHYAICDVDSDGIYDKAELTIDDDHGEGDTLDDYLMENNDEVLMDGDMVIFKDHHLEAFVNTTMAGQQDIGLKSLEWRVGRWRVEGKSNSFVLSDQDSDLAFDTIHLDMNDDGSYNGEKDIIDGMDGFRGGLVMRYHVAFIDEDGTTVEMAPMNASVGDTDLWMVGYARLEETNVAIAVSDTDDNGVFETVDLDIDGNGVIDAKGLTETGDGMATIQGDEYQVIKMDLSGKWVRFIEYGDGVIDSAVDISSTNTVNYGSVDENKVGYDMNGDGDLDDALNVLVVDIAETGHVNARMRVFVDVDLDGGFLEDDAMMLGTRFEMGGTEWLLDHVTSTKNRVGIKRVQDPSATYRTGPDGKFTLALERTGTYWIRMTSSYEGWGYELFEDTNGNKGYEVTAAGMTDKDLVLIQSETSMSGKVTDMITGEALEGVKVEVFNMLGARFVSTYTLSDGTYLLGVQRNLVYDVSFSKDGYFPDDGTDPDGTWHGMAIGSGRDDVDVSLMPDPAPDIIHFVEPADGTVVTGRIAIAVERTEIVSVDDVKMTMNNGLSWNTMNLTNGSRYGYSWNTEDSPDGVYTLVARATNSVGLRADAILNITVDNSGPVVVIRTAPEQYGKVEIQVKANDEFSDVAKVEVRIDGGAWQRMSKGADDYYYIWSSGPFDSGSHSYEIRATDTLGNQEHYTSKVEVDNTWMLLLVVMVVLVVVLLVVMVMMRKKGRPTGTTVSDQDEEGPGDDGPGDDGPGGDGSGGDGPGDDGPGDDGPGDDGPGDDGPGDDGPGDDGPDDAPGPEVMEKTPKEETPKEGGQ